MTKTVDELAEMIVDAYDIVDPYGQMDAFDSKEEAIASAKNCLTCWKPGEIKESIIQDLEGYVLEGIVEGKEADEILETVSALGEYIYSMKSAKNEDIEQLRECSCGWKGYKIGWEWSQDENAYMASCPMCGKRLNSTATTPPFPVSE